jgi:hypothetical protein
MVFPLPLSCTSVTGAQQTRFTTAAVRKNAHGSAEFSTNSLLRLARPALSARGRSARAALPEQSQLELDHRPAPKPRALDRGAAAQNAAGSARGVDPELVYIDVWAPGDDPLPNEVAAQLPYGHDTRLLRCLFFHRAAPPEELDPAPRPEDVTAAD